MNARILVGISTYNDFQHLTLLLHSIRLYTVLQEAFDIVVCDDGSRTEFMNGTDETAQYEMIDDNRVNVNSIRGTCRKFGVTLIENGGNKGIPTTWNQLCNALGAQSEIIVLLNNDLLMVPHWLTVAVDFLDRNKDNPHVGSCFWNPFNGFSIEMMKSMLPELTHTIYASAYITTGRERSLDTMRSLFDAREGHNQGMGRVMCPCGCCFAFRRDVYNECGPFDERLTSFHEESIQGDRYTVYKTDSGDVFVQTMDEMFTRYVDTLVVQGTKEYVFPKGVYALSANVSHDTEDIIAHHLIEREAGALADVVDTTSATVTARRQAKKKLQQDALHVNVGVWDKIEYIVRHTTTKALVQTKSKMGCTVTTPDHSLIAYDTETNALVKAKPNEIAGQCLERVNVIPQIDEVTSIDLAECLQDVDRVVFDDDCIWYTPKRSSSNLRIQRFIECDTPEMDALCLLLGAYVSEGCIPKNYNADGTRQCTVWCGNDTQKRDTIVQAFVLLFGIQPTVSRRRKEHYRDVFSVVTGYRIITLLFEALCNKGSANVRLPHFVYRLSETHRKQVLDSLLDGDGFRPKELSYYYRSENAMQKYFLYTTKSRALIADLSLLFTQFGIKFTIGYRKTVDAYWIRSVVKVYGPRGNEAMLEEIEPAGTTKYVYDLGTVNTHKFVDAHGLILVHNSDWGTRCADHGRIALGFPWPRPYHKHGASFAVNPELNASERMRGSRKLYREIWKVPENIAGDKYFDYVNAQLMSRIPPVTVSFLAPNYDLPPTRYTLQNQSGELTLPTLTLHERTYEYHT